MHLIEDNNDPAALTFKWKMLAMGGNPAEGGAGFSNPDNLVFDQKGNLWMVNDMSTAKQNNPKDRTHFQFKNVYMCIYTDLLQKKE